MVALLEILTVMMLVVLMVVLKAESLVACLDY
jgi:hypothetical protein